MNKTNTTERPADFDARVMAYLPGLRRLAAKYVPRPYREDLVTDTIIYALDRWKNYREDGGMWNWLSWNMRGIATNAAKKVASQKNRAIFVPLTHHDSAVAPAQEGYVQLSEALRLVASHRHGSVLLRRAMGDGLKEIAVERGTTVEWARQMEVAARKAVMVAA